MVIMYRAFSVIWMILACYVAFVQDKNALGYLIMAELMMIAAKLEQRA